METPSNSEKNIKQTLSNLLYTIFRDKKPKPFDKELDTSAIIDSLFPKGVPKAFEGESYQTALLEQYKTLQESFEQGLNRKSNANNFYTTVNLLLMSAMGWSFIYFSKYILILSIIGLFFSLVWYSNSKTSEYYHHCLFLMIAIIEGALPAQISLAQYVIHERYVLKEFPRFLHFRFDKMPFVFGAIYSGCLLYRLIVIAI